MRAVAMSAALALGGVGASGCTSLAPQLPATDYEHLEGIHSREGREAAYELHRIRMHREMNGLRFTKGDNPNAPKLGWQSLDRVLRSDRNSAAALPDRKRKLVRVFTGLTITSLVASTAGIAGTAREGLDTSSFSGSSALLLFGGLASVGFAITAGVLYGQMRRDYVAAVDVYNDSLGLRLGLYDAEGKYLPPAGTLIDDEGFVILSDDEVEQAETPVPRPQSGGPSTSEGSDETGAPVQDPARPEPGESETGVEASGADSTAPEDDADTAPAGAAASDDDGGSDAPKAAPRVQKPRAGGAPDTEAGPGLSLRSR